MRKTNYKNIYQFKITLKGSKPLIWRRILVPENYSFWDLHVAIQDSMGWHDCHLHEFETIDSNYKKVKKIGIPEFEYTESGILPDWQENISDWFSLDKRKAINYIYDFGDNWEHRVELEKIIKKNDDVNYPICIEGKRACPPEDSGGLWGYEDKLNILKDPKHPGYDELVEWMGEDFDPEEFNCDDVVFSDPLERLKDSSLLEEFQNKSNNIKTIQKTKPTYKAGLNWEIDYSELSHPLKDENGKIIKPMLMIIVHPESFFIIATHLASPNGDYLQEFSDKIISAINEGPFIPEKILVKKKELFDFLEKTLKGREIKLDLVKRTKTVESVKRDMGKFFN